ncbi:L-seryl-tRNA(Sec) selenium transferase [Mariniblastus fucicola]|uniref:L-seryl-tRNA(Sec) selenium transferase n=1 Tax=Mariniblastus fucicola TaxID=980251 RepID=A0A5B9PDD4_9BACT|nr:L-seryl-tRNA(Sec) selenium transferase [Mariniblastus fucicola]QEG23205.1 L-seryl-tRNA(Sec) selenium transferase [Mariniblastus fucicola]
MSNILRNLPSVSQLLESPQLKKMVENINHGVVAEGVRTFLDDLRTQVVDAAGEVPIPTPTEMADRIADWLSNEERPYLRRVINGTGIVLHTGLGRAPLAAEALAAVNENSKSYASVEINLMTGERGQRVKAVERLICELTGAEAAVVTNNNAAATMLTLSAMAAGKEVIVSRGQLIEIGGSYRLPDVMECSGAKLKEVGTTNKTHLADYENAIDPELTGALLKVHPSNFEVIGFTKTISTKELSKLAAKHDLPLIDDIGSGALLDYAQFGLRNEPVASESIRDGADLILFSGDKLIGGPQCGIIAGKKKYVDRILKNPLMRAMRVGKMTLSALHATLSLYRDQEKAKQSIPLLRMLSMPAENLKLRAEKLASLLSAVPCVGSCEAIQEEAMLGGGSLPAQKIPTWCVSITPAGSVDALSAKLRSGTPAVMGRVQQGKLLLDTRTISPAEDLELVKVFETLEA